jgi:hypothetical protein
MIRNHAITLQFLFLKILISFHFGEMLTEMIVSAETVRKSLSTYKYVLQCVPG